MRTIYRVRGMLDEGFVGQISYTVCLDQVYDTMDIAFTFQKQRYSEITKEMAKELRNVCDGSYELKNGSDNEWIQAMKDMKTEIHTLVSMNETFIGGVHKQLTTRHMQFSPGYASDGCIPQETIEGVIKITLVVFNVLCDDTEYQLTLSVNDPDSSALTEEKGTVCING